MITIPAFTKLALSFADVVQLPHFELISFRVNKKIFATLDEKNNRAMVKLSLPDQSSFSSYDPTIIYPVPNAWGAQGATYIELDKVGRAILKDALTTAYHTAAQKKLAGKPKK